VLEEVRMLSGVETTKEKVLRIILAGQPELNEKLNSPDLIQLTQRVRLRFHLTSLNKAETAAYIEHRLEVAGSQGRRIFAEDMYATIFKYTGGVPRLINTLCDTCLMAAYGKDQDTVTMADLDDAIEELQWVEFASGTNQMKILEMEHSQRSHIDADQIDTGHVVGRILLACEGRTIEERQLRPGRLVIGRTPDNDIQIDSKFISRHHCQIITQSHSCLIEDLNSTNGISVQSKRVRRHNLNDGDVVQVGQHEIMYIDERSPRVRNSPEPTDPAVATAVLGGAPKES
jgi:general secretion pathway protein A